MSAMIPDASIDVLEVYKIYLVDLGNIGSRHTEANKFYVSLLSVILVVIGLTGGKDAPLSGFVELQQSVALLAISISALWFATIATYARLYRAKFMVLRRLEDELTLTVRPFQAEAQALGKFVHLSMIERLVAVLMTAPFFVVLQHLGANWLWALLAADCVFLVLIIATTIAGPLTTAATEAASTGRSNANTTK